MKRLGVSLIFVVVVAVIGIGWLITELDILTSEVDPASNPELAIYERIAQDMARVLDDIPDRRVFLEQWPQQSELQFAVGAPSNFPVPAELREEFDAGDPLILEAEGSVSINIRMPRSGDVLSLVLPEARVRSALFRPSLLLTLLFYVGVVAAILLWLYPLVTRLLALRATAQAFGRGRLQSRVVTSRFSAIGDIESEFNHMAERIQTLVADNKLLGQAVSHNLKTPLARLRFGLDALNEADDEATREKYAQRISRDLAEMESLVETLLQYAKLDQAQVQMQKQRVELNAFVAQLLGDFDEAAQRIEFRAGGTDLFITTDPGYLALQLNNLMSNALTYARTRIRVSVVATPATVSILVEDDGPGIPAQEQDAVLEPFRRGSNAGPGGHGMGLAIVTRIARWLDCSVIVGDSVELGGTSVSLRFDR
jgi:signal transduction histidine kinase